MAVKSSGILLYRIREGVLEVWIAHMGGPFWARKDAGAWTIPKGENDGVDDTLAVAKREFEEEIGVPAPDVPYELLGEFVQSSRKTVTVYTAEADFLISRIVSNTFSLEWPPRSGVIVEFPEVDDAGWFSATEARPKVIRGQVPVLDRLIERLLADGRDITTH